jgi:hypothetical protein
MTPNKLVVCCPGDDPELAREVGMQVGEVSVQFVLWVDSPTAIVERRCQEIALKLKEDTKNLSYRELKSHVLAKIGDTAQRTYFKKMEVSDTAKAQLAESNRGGWPYEKSYWRMDHLKDGFWGGIAPRFVDGVTPIHDNDEAIAQWALTRTLCNLVKQS